MAAAKCQNRLDIWFRVMIGSGTLPEAIECVREAYRGDVAVLPPHDVRDIITLEGFDSAVLYFQAGMIHAWFAERSSRHH
jgi:tRNA (cmo5U34)-methyltransferase